MARKFKLALAVAAIVAVASACVSTLGTLPGDDTSVGSGINQSGVVVGESRTVAGPASGFRSRPGGTMERLAPRAGDNESEAYAVNAGGTAVGRSCGSRSATDPGVWGCDAVVWDPSGTLSTLGSFGYIAEAHAINTNGLVVGLIETRAADGSSVRNAVYWSPGDATPTVLPLLPNASWPYASMANDSGQIVGNMRFADNRTHAVRWQVGSSTIDDLGLGEATSINTSGVVAGMGPSNHAAIWYPGASTPVDLGTFGGISFVGGLNDNGVVVGLSQIAAGGDYHVFSWTASTGMKDLGTLGYQSANVQGINNNGKAVGSAVTNDGWRAFVFDVPQ